MGDVLRVEGLHKRYCRGGLRVEALRGVDLSLEAGQTLGVLGESGCGKTSLARCIVGLERPDAGRVLLDGASLYGGRAGGGCAPAQGQPSGAARAALRRRIQLVFQDPATSLDPRLTAAEILAEPLHVHGLARGTRQVAQRTAGLMAQVELDAGLLGRYPHQLSGGQAQRLALARALACQPDVIIADEPVSSLDLPLRARLLDLLVDLQRRHGLSYLVISHDVSALRQVAGRVAVMYMGRAVESAVASDLLLRPRHPYTRALLEAEACFSLGADPGVELQPGGPPPPAGTLRPAGCPFHPRCPVYRERRGSRCVQQEPGLTAAAPGHEVACHEAV